VDVDSSVIKQGLNIIAVELHNSTQDASGDDDAVSSASLSFGLQSGRTLRPPPRPPMNITRTGGNLRIGWQTNGLGTNSGYVLQFANHIATNLWREVQTNMANPFVTPMTNAARFYRLCWE